MPHNRPPLPERYDLMVQMRSAFNNLKKLYAKYGHEELREQMKVWEGIMNTYEQQEVYFRYLEQEETERLLAQLSHTVRTWELYYRPQEFDLSDDASQQDSYQ